MQILKPSYKDILIVRNQNTSQIAGAVVKAIKDSQKQAELIAPYLKGNSRLSTLNNVWKFSKNNIKYEREKNSLQTAKTLSRIIADKKGDCKHYTTLIASILKALNIPFKLRLISQNYFSPEPTHIYIVSYVNGKEIAVDGVLKNFGTEASYKYKYDIKC